ncbi:alpha/beta hydrolase-fold protein [Streptococcus sp. NLN76]|uniref:alpha/beta hydrolase n=1 Tax=Streptococcus sp. NLN76 TaxID=2822800 RepID=UPI0018A94F87|nr:alpha/beta hydrolase-fold protein [Streptococcus sp. NLN76]MBF8970012.1 hypothetical protein [Streptococcus sp. NLN76]
MNIHKLKRIPSDYFRPSKQPGTLEVLDYQTYESFSYQTTSPILLKKQAVVYLPYGYDPNKLYPVLYLSHGGWSNETTTMGRPGRPATFKHIVDHAIANGEVEPTIIVNLTYNNTSPQDSRDFGLAIQLTQRYNQELVHDLIPAVESRYSSYAQSTSSEDLKASRRYRGFSGFSMGSVNTWRTFENALEYFYFFNPMSGNVNTPAQTHANLVREKNQPFFIWAASGTHDFAYQAFRRQIMNLLQEAPDVFREEEIVVYRERVGAQHDYAAVCDYTYNALRYFGKV